MTINTVRARLTLWYAAALSAVLLLFSLGVYGLFSNTLRNRLDDRLRSAAEVTQLALNHEIEEHGGRQLGEFNVREVLRTMHQTSFPRTAIAIWDGDRLVGEKDGLQGLGAPMAPRRRMGIGVHTVQVNESRYRLIVADAPVPFISAKYRVMANESLQEVEAELANMRYILWLTVPLCVVASAAAGFFLARKSLHPVAAIAETLEHITSANLDQRLQMPNRADEFGRLGDTINKLLDRLAQAFAQRQRFMADASHELRTPLSVALTAAQVTLQKRDRDEAELREALALVEEQLRRLKHIVEEMFILAQADAGAYQPANAPLYLTDVADEALRAARILARSKDIEVHDHRSGADLDYEGDEDLLRQLLLILIDNAVKYTPAGGRVTLNLETRDGGYLLEVADTGPGISAADQPYIFDRFYRADVARSRRYPGAGSGAGLGLAIAQWITELHGGVISVSSSDAGSTFRVWLPSSQPLRAQPSRS